MAAEAEASREARAKVIAADGEMRASKALREASNIIDESPSALQLRYLQVMHRVIWGAGQGGPRPSQYLEQQKQGSFFY